MKKRVLSLILILCMVCTLIPAAAGEDAPVSVTAIGTRNDSQAREVFGLLNQARTENELPQLQHSLTLSRLAMQRAAEISLYYDHDHHRPDDSDCFTVLDGAYSDYTAAAENIAAGQADAQEVMEAWLGSEGHRINIMNEAYTQVGVGCFEAGGIRTWVQLFGNSTSDTEITDQTGTAAVHVPISASPAHLQVTPSGTQALHLDVGQTHTFRMIQHNILDGQELNQLPLLPQTADAVTADGTTVAEITVDASGLVRIQAVADGQATARFPLGENDPSPYTLELTVGDVPTDPEPTDPEPTDPEPTDPEPTDPEPTDPPEPVYSLSLRHSGGGTASVSASSACRGELLVLTVLPDPDFQLDQILLRTSDRRPNLRKIDDTTFQFLMPGSDLEIEVYFESSLTCPFVDVRPDDYFYEPVLWATRNQITSGMDARHFGPNDPCTRAQVVTFLWSAAGKPQPQSHDNPFSDVGSDDYFFEAVLWAVENGITAGMDDTHFGSGRPCTRAQVVTFLWSAEGKPRSSDRTEPFTDVSPQDYFYEAVLWALEHDVTAGMDDSHFGSEQSCTRGQIVTFLYKAQ